jgi:hypothetical protein
MIFESLEQHSSQQIRHIRELIKKHHELPRQTQAWLAVQLVQHGWPQARQSIQNFQNQFQSQEVKAFLNKLIAQTYVVEEIPNWSELRGDSKVMKSFYDLNGYVYLPGKEHKQKLVILFSTMYNNFYLSNAIISLLLKSWGVSVLLVKDATRFQYLNGIKGLGSDLFKVGQNLSKFIDQKNFTEVYILGFSSGGYGSLFLSTQIHCDAYLGFSVHTHLANRDEFPLGKYLTPEVLRQVSPDSLLNLRELIDQETRVPLRTLVYGAASAGDRVQADNLKACRGVEIISLPDCGHVTVAEMIEQRTFIPLLKKLIFSKSG